MPVSEGHAKVKVTCEGYAPITSDDIEIYNGTMVQLSKLDEMLDNNNCILYEDYTKDN